MKINPEKIVSWQVATKTKPIRAKALINLLVDRTVTNKFLVDTLEGREPLGDGVVICIGQSMDAWQQTPKKLLAKYEVKGLDKDSWMECEPRPDNAVNVVQVDAAFLLNMFPEDTGLQDAMSHTSISFHIIGKWGETIGGETNVQKGQEGDYICQDRNDPSDVWIVKRKIFENTYAIK